MTSTYCKSLKNAFLRLQLAMIGLSTRTKVPKSTEEPILVTIAQWENLAFDQRCTKRGNSHPQRSHSHVPGISTFCPKISHSPTIPGNDFNLEDSRFPGNSLVLKIIKTCEKKISKAEIEKWGTVDMPLF